VSEFDDERTVLIGENWIFIVYNYLNGLPDVIDVQDVLGGKVSNFWELCQTIISE
jgi:hypothetical protein